MIAMLEALASAIGYMALTVGGIAATVWFIWQCVELMWTRLKWGTHLIEFLQWKRARRKRDET
jgi:hypothetical protein